MGLIYHILIGFVHLLFVAMDIVLLMIAVKVVYDRWKPSWLKQLMHAVEPLINFALKYTADISLKVTGKTYSDKTLMLLIIVCMFTARLIVAGLL